jgi:Rnl2 family RNA ligase
VYLNEDIKGMLCEKFGIFWDKPIFEGTFQECINYSNEYQTTIPAILGLPEIDGNICEGNVIKPINADWFWCGSRVIFKNKNAKFAENTGKASGQKLMKTDKESVVLSEKGQELFETMLGYVNENRLRNLISKIGKITDKDFGKLMGGCQKDTIEDFLKDYRDEFLALDVKEQKFIPKRIGAEWTTIIRKNFLDIIDNTF